MSKERHLLIITICILSICLNFSCKKLENKTSKPNRGLSIDEEKSQASYEILHYWDSFDFSDTARIHRPDITEQAFVDFINILPQYDSVTIRNSIKNMLQQAQLKDSTNSAYHHLLKLSDHYLYDPNSPFRNEELYIPVMEYIIQSRLSDDATQQRTEFNLKMILKNRLGTIASDITYTIASGSSSNLYAIESPYTILYFYNPDCTACKEATVFLKNSKKINELLENRKLSVLAVYTDADLNLWKKHLNEIPSNWIVGYDKGQQIEKRKSYELRAIPSLYLLDKDKRVLLKDANAGDIQKFLLNIQ
ncbi:MAG: DUF5106 domain-containing protein [Dysgonomonas sp.]